MKIATRSLGYLFFLFTVIACGNSERRSVTKLPTPTVTGAACIDDSQCIGASCSGGFCPVGTATVGVSCSRDSQCDSDRCMHDSCAAEDGIGATCGRDTDCANALYCHFASGAAAADGICTRRCAGDSDCDFGQECFAASGGVSGDVSGGSGLRCYTLDSCRNGNDCHADESCVDDVCTHAVDTQVDHCRLISPISVSADANESITVVAQVLEAGITDLTSGVDSTADLLAQAGYGTKDSNPSNNPSWRWVNSVGDSTWSDSAEEALTNYDQYKGFLTVPVADDYDIAFRFSKDRGTTWLYCDLDSGSAGGDGSEDGYQIARAGKLTILPGPCDTNPCTVPPANECAALTSGATTSTTLLDYPSLGLCSVVEGAAQCEYLPREVDCALTRATCGADSGATAGSACIGGAVQPVNAGDVVITEYMARSRPGGFDYGEWLEVYNPSPDTAYNLSGCYLADDGTDNHQIGSVVIIDPKSYVVLAASALPEDNYGIEIVDYEYARQFIFTNSGDEVIIRCNSTVIDKIAYSSSRLTGTTSQLEPSLLNATDNNLTANFCPATTLFGNDGKLGTPRAPNVTCPAFDITIDHCRLLSSAVTEIYAGHTLNMEVLMRKDNLTTLTSGIDTDNPLVAEVGFGTAGSDPASWSFSSATPDTTWNDTLGNHTGYDHYLGTPVLPTAGSYQYAFRFSHDLGNTWTYCDIDTGITGQDGSENGFQNNDAGQITVLTNPCLPNTCTPSVAATCNIDGVTLHGFESLGSCAIALDGSAQCTDIAQDTNCAERGGTCTTDITTTISSCANTWRAPQIANDLVITEVMYAPDAELATAAGAQWLELYNPSNETWLLDGCTLSTLISTSTAIVGTDAATANIVSIPPQGYAVLANSADTALNGGIVVDGTFDATFGATADTLSISCNGTAISSVTYDHGTTLPGAKTTSIALTGTILNGVGADLGSNWCLGHTSYYPALQATPPAAPLTEHYGTPGVANPICAPIDHCRLQWPFILTDIDIASSHEIFVRFSQTGLTDRTDGNDSQVGIIAELGVGPRDTDPAALSQPVSWNWQSATPNISWNSFTNAFPETGSDEYSTQLIAPSPNSYDYAYRVSNDNGFSWTYCDKDTAVIGEDGSENGYQIANAGKMSTVGPNLYFSEYVEGSSNDKAIEIKNAGNAPFDLTQCSLRIYANGRSTPSNTTPLIPPATVTLLPVGAVHTMCHTLASTDLNPIIGSPCDQLDAKINFNGNDAVELFCLGISMDIIGQIGFAPIVEWGGGLDNTGAAIPSTANNTLRRKCAFTTGDTVGSDIFDPAIEWSQSLLGDYSGLGSAVCAP